MPLPVAQLDLPAAARPPRSARTLRGQARLALDLTLRDQPARLTVSVTIAPDPASPLDLAVTHLRAELHTSATTPSVLHDGPAPEGARASIFSLNLLNIDIPSLLTCTITICPRPAPALYVATPLLARVGILPGAIERPTSAFLENT